MSCYIVYCEKHMYASYVEVYVNLIAYIYKVLYLSSFMNYDM